MPCSISKEEEQYYEREDNFKKYGTKELSSRIATRVACEMSRTLEENGLLHQLSTVAQKWIAEHKKEDEERDG